MTWYTWLEQGRAVRASEQVIGAIARALLCNETETHHLFNLAGLAAPTSARRVVCEKPSAATQAILDALDPLPAMVQNARFDIRGYNRAYCRLVGIDLAEIPEEDRNCIYLALTHERWRYCMANREEALPRMVGFFRAAMVERMGDPLWERQLQRCLEVSAEFREIWRRNEVMGIETVSSASVMRAAANSNCSRPTGGRRRRTAIACWSSSPSTTTPATAWSNFESAPCPVASACSTCCRFCAGTVTRWPGMCSPANWGSACAPSTAISPPCDSRARTSRAAPAPSVAARVA